MCIYRQTNIFTVILKSPIKLMLINLCVSEPWEGKCLPYLWKVFLFHPKTNAVWCHKFKIATK